MSVRWCSPGPVAEGSVAGAGVLATPRCSASAGGPGGTAPGERPVAPWGGVSRASSGSRVTPGGSHAAASAVTANRTPAAPIRRDRCATGCAGSRGRYAAPAVSTASWAATSGTERGSSRATVSPRRTPAAVRRAARAAAPARSSAYVTARSAERTATASGVRDAWYAKRSGTVAGPGSAPPAGRSGPVDAASSAARSAGGSTSSRPTGRPGSPASSSSARSRRAATAPGAMPRRQDTRSSMRSPATTATVTG